MVTDSGGAARLISDYRPEANVVALTSSEVTFRPARAVLGRDPGEMIGPPRRWTSRSRVDQIEATLSRCATLAELVPLRIASSCARRPACRSSRRSRSPRPSRTREEIIYAADCVMVARGDLGIELPIEEVPVQKCAARAGRPIARPVDHRDADARLDGTSPRPTRAEVADVANAILDGTDAVMLSQETAIGAHPVEAIAMMAAVAGETEKAAPYERWTRARAPRPARPGVHRRAPGRSRRRASCGLDASSCRRCRAARPAWSPRTARGADPRALAGPRDGPPLRADVGRARRVDAPPRGHRGAHRRRRRRVVELGWCQPRPARRHHAGLPSGATGDDEHSSKSKTVVKRTARMPADRHGHQQRRPRRSSPAGRSRRTSRRARRRRTSLGAPPSAVASVKRARHAPSGRPRS